MASVISVENLSKKYIIGHQKQERYTALRDVLTEGAKRFTHKLIHPFAASENDPTHEEFWALRDVSFDIQQGDRVGIIGRNGAGKSTLLKILSRITEPTSGRISIKGRVASLLEVGTGFHPELSGRENIYLNGAILGMSKAEIKSKFDEIVAFAEIEKFLDTPVKRYSSGMYVRLAFAVAAHLEPEILIVDEVLAVGDAQFQKKCLGKMEEVGKEGRTVIFVSHNMAAMQSLCMKGILLHAGSVQYIGNQTDAIAAYLAGLTSLFDSLATRVDRQGSGEVQIQYVSLMNGAGELIESAVSGEGIRIRLYFNKNGSQSNSRIIASVTVKTQTGTPVFMVHSRLTGDSLGTIPAQGFFELMIPRLPLPSSVYIIGFSLMEDGTYIDAIEDAKELIVVDGNFFVSHETPPISHGVCLVDGRWSMHHI
jgi:lipopolysaccharide transport system ATP-binding protein